MTWLTWRLQRTEWLLLIAVCVCTSGLLLATHQDVVKVVNTSCPAGNLPISCTVTTGEAYRLLESALPWFNFLPLIAAMLLALPVIIELNSGTFRLAWTQGVTRFRWTAFRMACMVSGGIVFGAVFTAAFWYWSSPRYAVEGRVGQDYYDMLGTLPIAHTLFAIGLVVAIGVVLQRTISAFFLATAAFVAIRLPFMLWIRPHLVHAIKTMVDIRSAAEPTGGWELESYWLDTSGARVSESQLMQLCPPVQMVSRDRLLACVSDHGLVRYRVFHPESHFWALQLRESAIFFALALALMGFAGWFVLKRVE